MPQRRGLSAGLAAGADALSNVFGGIAARNGAQTIQAQGERRREGLALLKDWHDKVISGEMEPAQAIAAARDFGVAIPDGFFSDVQPSTSKRLASVMAPVQGASSFAGVPTDEDLSVQLKGKGLNPITNSNIPSQFQDASAGPIFDQLNPEAANAVGAKRRALVAAIAPTKGDTAYDAELGTTVREPDKRFNPITQDFDVFGTKTQTGPTPAQAGENEATKAVTAKRGENAGGLPELTADAFNRTEDLTRGAKAKTAASNASATTQADINVNTNPANVAKKATAQATIETAVEKAKQDLKEAGVPANIADSFMRVTATGIPYAYIDPSVPTEIRNVATKRAATSVPGIRFLTKPQADTMQQIDSARAGLKTYLEAYKNKLGQGAAGRAVSAVRNTLGIQSQADSDLAGVSAAMYGPMIELFRASTAGVTGFRMTQAELARAQKAVPEPTDSYQTAIVKAKTLGDLLAGLERQIGTPGGAR